MNTLLLSVDVEEWFMAENVKPYCAGADVDRANHSSMGAFADLLTVFRELGVNATLFVVSELLSDPECFKLLRLAVQDGHEIASHSKTHQILTGLSSTETFVEVAHSKRALEVALDVEVSGFRSPCFTTNAHLDQCLLDSGYAYTSNGIEASLHDRYGQTAFSGRLVDFAIPCFRLFGLKIPATGGGWFRLFPLWLQKLMLQNEDPVVFYCHPWAFDFQQPVLATMPVFTRLRHTVNNRGARRKLINLIGSFAKCETYLSYYHRIESRS